jgi:predicted transcriptional regulator with HTH domain
LCDNNGQCRCPKCQEYDDNKKECVPSCKDEAGCDAPSSTCSTSNVQCNLVYAFFSIFVLLASSLSFSRAVRSFSHNERCCLFRLIVQRDGLENLVNVGMVCLITNVGSKNTILIVVICANRFFVVCCSNAGIGECAASPAANPLCSINDLSPVQIQVIRYIVIRSSFCLLSVVAIL